MLPPTGNITMLKTPEDDSSTWSETLDFVYPSSTLQKLEPSDK